jgi:membrane protein YqaA with SNARE-associated domain
MVYDIIEPIIHNSFFVKYGLVGLFLNGMLSSIIPIPTELTISALLLSGKDKFTVFVTLAISSIVGGFMAYYIGFSGNKFVKIFYKKPHKKHEDKTRALLERYGWLIIFFSPWIPIVGDIIPMIAGAKRYNLKNFTIVMISGKVFKATAIVFLSSWILPFIFR